MALTSPLTSAKFVRLLKKDMREVSENRFKELPSIIPKYYRVIKGDNAWEEFYNVTGLPDIDEFNGKLTYIGPSPGYHVKIEPKQFAAGVETERKFIDDNKWGVLRDHARGLMEAMVRTREKYAVHVFNYAFSTAFEFMQSEENLSLCNDSHTTKSGTSTSSGFDNAGTSALSKTSAAATWLAMRRFRNDISERIDMSDNFAIIVPDALGDTAEEIAGTVKSLDTADGNINPQYGRYKVERLMRLDDYSETNWFMVNWDLMKKFLIWDDRIPAEIDTLVDFETKSIKHSIYGRWGYGFLDFRWIYGHNVT